MNLSQYTYLWGITITTSLVVHTRLSSSIIRCGSTSTNDSTKLQKDTNELIFHHFRLSSGIIFTSHFCKQLFLTISLRIAIHLILCDWVQRDFFFLKIKIMFPYIYICSWDILMQIEKTHYKQPKFNNMPWHITSNKTLYLHNCDAGQGEMLTQELLWSHKFDIHLLLSLLLFFSSYHVLSYM